MSKYAIAINRLFHPTKYPLYRTVPLRYVFLHLLIFSFLLSWPNIINLYQSSHSLKNLIQNQEHLIPQFTIQDGELHLPDHKDVKINLDTGQVVFTESNKHQPSDLLTFAKDKLYIKNYDAVSYQNLSTIKNKDQMIKTLQVYTQSSFFFLILVILAMMIIQYTILLIKSFIIGLIAHLAALFLKKKSNVMNGFKTATFLLTLPVILQYIGMLVSNTLFNIVSWCIIIVLVGLAVYHLPGRKNKNHKIKGASSNA